MRRFGETPPTWTNEFLETLSSAFLFAYRQNAGETPAIHWSRLLFRIAGVLLGFLQIRRRDVCVPSQFFVTQNCLTCPSCP
ncbi:MAG: hypothetical protein LBP59_05860 [Planctomycetaceae bacterium]|nr:hypothetical protein [Planctomycetaceae bacterium]